MVNSSITFVDFLQYLLAGPALAIVLAVIIATLVFGVSLLLSVAFSPIVYKRYWVKKAATELGISGEEVLRRFRDFLREVSTSFESVQFKGYTFTSYYTMADRDDLGMRTSPRLRLIMYTPVWIYHVVVCGDLWKDAFYQSVGHEVHHSFDPKKKCMIFRKTEDRRFLNWATELRCDFGGVYLAEKLTGHSKERIIQAMEKKADAYKAKKKGKQKPTMTHPSWNFRIAMVNQHEQFTFDTLKEVAAAAGCKDDDFIEDVDGSFLPF